MDSRQLMQEPRVSKGDGGGRDGAGGGGADDEGNDEDDGDDDGERPRYISKAEAEAGSRAGGGVRDGL